MDFPLKDRPINIVGIKMEVELLEDQFLAKIILSNYKQL